MHTIQMKEFIQKRLEEYDADARKLRHYFHEHPEVSNHEVETSKFLKQKAASLGLEIEEVPADDQSDGYGFIATLNTGKPGKTIGLRTDIDGLPITENPKNLSHSRKVQSKHEGVMHACGHDGHMTTLLMTMKLLTELKDQLTGTIIFIFEEGEEEITGIGGMIEHLKGRNIEAIYGNHFASFLETGKISADPGPVMAAATTVDFKVIGQGGHASRPDLSVNPLYAGVDILNSLSVTWNNQLNIEKTVTLGMTQFHVGEAVNVFADEARIGGSIRYFDEDEGAKAYELVKKVARNVAKTHNCDIELMPASGPKTIPVINDEALAEQVQESIDALFPGHLEKDVNWYASESFSHYREVAPYVFTFVGIKNEALGSGAEHHSELFDFDDEALKYAIGSMTKFTVDLLSK